MKYLAILLLFASCTAQLPVTTKPQHSKCAKITVEYNGAVLPLYYCDTAHIDKVFKSLNVK